MEWLFYVTKPSFFSVLTLPQSATVLLVAPLPYAIVVLGWLGLAALAALARVPRRIVAALCALVPAVFLCSALILLIDNFTYTVMKFGLVTARNAFRYLYAAFFVGLFSWLFWVLARRIYEEGRGARWALLSIGGLVGLSVLSLILALATRVSIHQPNATELSLAERPPDIFLISGDAFEVEHFERYGNPVESGSFFSVLGPHALAFENSFSNSNRTGGSTPIALTGKYATTTRKYNSTRVFNGRDAYQHLPGILRGLGYSSIQLGAGHHVDAFNWGMRNAFDARNDKAADRSTLDRLSDSLGGRLNWEFHFTQILANRIWERLGHAFGGELIEQPHLAAKVYGKNKSKAMLDQLLAFLEEHPGPVLAQLHSMTTKGRDRGSSHPAGTILDEDVGVLVEDLKRTDRFENSIILIWSDHGKDYSTKRRLPLIVKFPENPGIPPDNLVWNTQSLDIAPTILDYLRAPIPEWMEGRSLLRPIDRYEPIFSTRTSGKVLGIEPDSTAPTVGGGVNTIGLIVCNHWYDVEITKERFKRGRVNKHTTPCDPKRLPSDREAECMIAQHLVDRGYRRVIGKECPLGDSVESL